MTKKQEEALQKLIGKKHSSTVGYELWTIVPGSTLEEAEQWSDGEFDSFEAAEEQADLDKDCARKGEFIIIEVKHTTQVKAIPLTFKARLTKRLETVIRDLDYLSTCNGLDLHNIIPELEKIKDGLGKLTND